MRLVSKLEDGGSNPSTCAKNNIMNNLNNLIISLIVDKMGMADKTDEPLKQSWLFPVEFYEHIPVEYPVMDILEKGELDKSSYESDSKFGCLGFGFLKE